VVAQLAAQLLPLFTHVIRLWRLLTLSTLLTPIGALASLCLRLLSVWPWASTCARIADMRPAWNEECKEPRAKRYYLLLPLLLYCVSFDWFCFCRCAIRYKQVSTVSWRLCFVWNHIMLTSQNSINSFTIQVATWPQKK